ncbi:HNH endonuclease signature motif containing protein [Pseudonocardia sp. D17]|uniref:HNH endonuclease signature motif containing protein n=1 Tax=Pseudonocardia sp. D17 TaxID=882661 RepID=UPI002B3C1B9D|nr:hypothetical protein PSD17_56450 [Pseudonocardia sp. D17]
MPTRPPRVCPRCGDAVSGRCTKCRPDDTGPRAWVRKPESWKGGSTRAWRRFRAAWLAEHPLCVGYGHRCGRVANHVDHIRSLGTFAAGPAREAARFDPGNVQSLCVDCHHAKTTQESIDARRARKTPEAYPDSLW